MAGVALQPHSSLAELNSTSAGQSGHPYYFRDSKNPNLNQDASKMPPIQSYPSPTAAQMGDGAHPFYTSQQQMPSADELQLSAQLSRNVAPNMTGNIGDGQEMVPPNQPGQDLRRQASPEELAQGGLDPNHDPSFGDSAPRKRSKVSRACDECRRKKVPHPHVSLTCSSQLTL